MELDSINSKANSALTTGIIGTVGTGLALLGGGFNGLFGNIGNTRTSDAEKIAALTSERDMLLSDQRNDGKMLELYKYLESKDKAQAEALNNFKMAQAVVNAQVSDNIAINSNNIATIQNTLSNLTKTVIPITNICPQPAVATTQTTTQ